MLLSFIVPVYNVAPYLEKCLNSLLNQTLQDIEIIIVDDNSSDGCGDLLDKYALRYPKIKVIHNPKNEKTANARNKGFKESKGDYVCFVDGDDYLDNNFAEVLYNTAIKTNANIVKGLTRTINQDGSTTISHKSNLKIKNDGKFYFFGHLWTAIYKRELLEKNKIYFHIDFFCFQIQAVFYANQVICVDNTFYNYVRHQGSCDSEVFTIEKWIRLNIGHGNFCYNWICSHNYENKAKSFYLKKIKSLYFYGFNRLEKHDILPVCKVLANTLIGNYNCGFNTKHYNSIVRKLFRKNKKTTLLQYVIYRAKGLL